jgi:hypothetical protein
LGAQTWYFLSGELLGFSKFLAKNLKLSSKDSAYFTEKNQGAGLIPLVNSDAVTIKEW